MSSPVPTGPALPTVRLDASDERQPLLKPDEAVVDVSEKADRRQKAKIPKVLVDWIKQLDEEIVTTTRSLRLLLDIPEGHGFADKVDRFERVMNSADLLNSFKLPAEVANLLKSLPEGNATQLAPANGDPP